MTTTQTSALVVDGSRGVGRSIALALSERGLRTTAVAVSESELLRLKAQVSKVEVIAVDATGDGVAERLLHRVRPGLIVLSAGCEPAIPPFHEQSWEQLSRAWNVDTRVAHAFCSAALRMPLRPGSVVVSFSSGAALGGSRLSSGYAGAKRMQHFLAEYAQREADLLALDITFYTVVPRQLIEGTTIGERAARAYAASSGRTVEAFMQQWEAALTPSRIAEQVMDLLDRPMPAESHTYALTGTGLAALA